MPTEAGRSGLNVRPTARKGADHKLRKEQKHPDSNQQPVKKERQHTRPVKGWHAYRNNPGSNHKAPIAMQGTYPSDAWVEASFHGLEIAQTCLGFVC